MSTTKKPLKRFSILDRCFSNTGRNNTFEGMREAVNEWMLKRDPQSSGIRVRQLRDDIAFMKSTDGWDAPIITIPGDGKKRYYCYEDPSFFITKRTVNETQVEELKMLVDALDAFKGLPQFPGLEYLIVKLQSDMDMAQKPNQAKIIDWGNNEFYKGKEYLGPLYRAVSQRKQIKMTYTPFGKEPKMFVTNPVYLKQYNNRWSVVALLEKDGFAFVNAFNLIDNLVVLGAEIPKDITFDAEEYFDPIVGVSHPMDGEIEEIQLTPDYYPYVKTKSIHHS